MSKPVNRSRNRQPEKPGRTVRPWRRGRSSTPATGPEMPRLATRHRQAKRGYREAWDQERIFIVGKYVRMLFPGAGDREAVRSIPAECRRRASMIRGSEMMGHVESSSLAYFKTRESAMKSATGKTDPDRSPPSAGPGNRCHSYGTYAIHGCVEFQQISNPCAGRRFACVWNARRGKAGSRRDGRSWICNGIHTRISLPMEAVRCL